MFVAFGCLAPACFLFGRHTIARFLQAIVAMSHCLPGKTQTALELHASSLAVTDDASWQDYTVLGVLYWPTGVILGVIKKMKATI